MNSITNKRKDQDMSPLVSVVMATYNGERFIKEAIQSVLDQTFSDFEFIIIDDGSTDSTEKKIHDFNDDRIVYIKKDINSGIADSLNLGISMAKGKYIARIDDDDVCLPNRLKEQVNFLDKHDDIILCATQVKSDQNDNIEQKPESHEDIKMQLLFGNAIVHPTVMIRKSILLKHNYNPDKVPSEDYDLWSRLICEGKFFKIEKPLLYYRYHKTSETSKRRKEQLLLNVGIAEFMFNKSGFKGIKNDDESIKALASHNYTISWKQLAQLIKWFDSLKRNNETEKIFHKEKFNELANTSLETFIIKFFANNSILKKIISFFYLNIDYKKIMLRYYINKWKK